MTEKTRPASDAAARERAIESNGSVLVQAPAGSGKTTLLVRRYLRLLALVDAPERILALTFTRRAAEEMRERVLQALGAAGEIACPADMNRETWELASAAGRHLQSLRLDVRRQPSRLRIETIDAFNAWLAGQLPVSAGAGSGLRVLADAKPCYEEAARRALARQEGDRFGAAVDRVLALDDQRWRQLVKLISATLSSRDRWLPLLAGRLQAASALDEPQLLRVRQHLDEDLRLLVSRALNRAREILGQERLAALSPLMQGAARRGAADRPEGSAWAADGSTLRADTADLARWRGLARLLLTVDGKIRRRLTKESGFPSGCTDKPPMQDLLQELDQTPHARQILLEVRDLPEPAYDDEQWGRVREVAQVLVLAAAELDQVLREQGAADFPAVSLAALRALGSTDAPTDLALRLDYRLQHILLDEFQDTSGAQLSLIALLTAGWQEGDGRSVFCVGDPMQSIYAFRQAEVRAFLELAEDGIGEVRFEVQRLRDNFRSAPPVVEWINASFARILPRTDDRNRGAIAFRPSVAAVRGSPEPAAAPAVALRGFATRSEESAAIARMIEEQLERHPAWRIAVLVRARTHAREIAAALRARGIAFRAVDIEPLQDRAVVRDIIMLTGALLHLADRTAWLAVLRAPWVGLSLADLLPIARGAALIWEALADESVLGQLSEDGRSRCRRLRSTLQAVFHVRNDTPMARWVERAWLGIGGASCVSSPQDLDLAAAAFARLRELEQRGLPDPADLPGAFADLYSDHGSSGAVEIMTIHKAKGLEFDMVVVPALDRHIAHSRDPLLVWHEFAGSGRDGMVMAARPAVGAAGDRLFAFLRRQLRDAAELEAERLLYVACTRAKWQLRLTARIGREEHPEDSAEGLAEPSGEAQTHADASAARRPWSPPAGSLLAVLWPVVGAEFAETEAHAEAPSEVLGAPRGGPLRRVPRDWMPGLGGAIPAAPMSAPVEMREDSPVFDWAGETARRVGTLVHAELQVMDAAGGEEAAIRARHAHFRRWLALHGVPAERLQEAADRVVEALAAVHRDPRGRWILQQSREDVREYALSGLGTGSGSSRREVVRVVFDRSFVDERGIRWVIDYKTSQHSGGGLEEFLDREVQRYRPQLQRYGMLAKRLGPEPVRLGLYFPLMRAWREWAA